MFREQEFHMVTRKPKNPEREEILRKISEVQAAQDRAELEQDPVKMHLIEVGEIMKVIKPLPLRQITVVLAPKGYNHSQFDTKQVQFDHSNGTLLVPSEKMDRIFPTHGGEYVSNGKKRYFYWDGKRLVDKIFTVELGEAGLVFNKPKVAKPARKK